MAKEAWTVFFSPEDAGTQPAANWKEKDISVKGKEKNSGLFAAEQLVSIKGAQGTELNRTANASLNLEKAIGAGSGPSLISNNPIQMRCVTVEAEGAEEAALAVARYYGADVVSGRALAAATANVSEVVCQ